MNFPAFPKEAVVETAARTNAPSIPAAIARQPNDAAYCSG